MITALLIAAAIGQLIVAVVNFRLVELLGWREEIAGMPLLLREIFTVHKWFVSVTLLIFGVITLRFADEFTRGDNPVATWLAAAIGLFWALRVAIQWLYYSHSHWRGRPGRTAIHWVLTAAYGGCAAVYLLAAFG